ncbi:acyl-CoA dehydrogenase [Xenophilus sp. AP218F]|nr:acyl-CoA dehydrogenase [Xenophilus sp. AP218F]
MERNVKHDLGRLLTREREAHRALGATLERQPARVEAMRDFAFAWQTNSMALPTARNRHPFVLPDGRELRRLNTRQRAELYEALGYLDPNLLFAAPGGSMAGFVVDGLGDEATRERFHAHFEGELCWTFFALSEPAVGSDASRLAARARKVDGGYLLDGEKYFIGNGALAPLGVVFARTNDGPLGLEAFLLETRGLAGFSARPLAPSGCPACNFAHLKLDGVFVPDSHRLGGHLKPTERFSRSALLTFDALRPCVAAAALGVAASLLDRAEETFRADARWLRAGRARLEAMRGLLFACCDDFDQGRRAGRRAGLMKAAATALAEALALETLHRAPAGAALDWPWLAKGWRDVKAFEYTEGTRFIHWQNAAAGFQEREHGAR